MEEQQVDRSPRDSSNPRTMGTMDLVREGMANAALLAKRQLDLLKLELTTEQRTELGALRRLAVAVALGMAGLVIMALGGVHWLALMTGVQPWLMALYVGLPLTLIGLIVGAAGWARRVQVVAPLSRIEVKEELQWIHTKTR